MNIEEAIEKLKTTVNACRNSKECWENECCDDCYVEVEDIFAIETVLNELENKDKTIDNMLDYIEKPYRITILGGKTKEKLKEYFEKK